MTVNDWKLPPGLREKEEEKQRGKQTKGSLK
jgi:hypothetical protein